MINMNGPFSDELRSPRVSVCDVLDVYASTKTLVRPCSSKKFLIYDGIEVQDVAFSERRLIADSGRWDYRFVGPASRAMAILFLSSVRSKDLMT